MRGRWVAVCSLLAVMLGTVLPSEQPARADEGVWTVIIEPAAGGTFAVPQGSGTSVWAASRTSAAVLDDPAVKDPTDGFPPPPPVASVAMAAWYRPEWQGGTTPYTWAFQRDARQPFAPEQWSKQWNDLIVWAADAYTSPEIILFVYGAGVPNTMKGHPVSYALVLTQAPAGYTGPTEFVLPPAPGTSDKSPWHKITLLAAGAIGANPIEAGSPPPAQMAAYRFTFVVRSDLTPPSAPLVVDDGQATASSSELRAHWSAGDPESGISEYLYAIGTELADPGSGYVVNWKSAGSQTEASVTGLSLVTGQTYYWYVKARNGATALSPAGVSDGILVDATPPSAPTVTASPDSATVQGPLHASWTSLDAESGVRQYQYAIGTSAADPGSGYVVGWRTSGTATEATETGLTLQPGQRYYFYVKAESGAGLWSLVGVSKAITVPPRYVGEPGEAKLEVDGAAVGLSGVVVSSGSGQLPGRVYVQSAGRSSGVAVKTGQALHVGDVVDVTGIIRTTNDGERYIDASVVAVTSAVAPPVPVRQLLRAAAGRNFRFNAATGAGQRGVTEPAGLSLNCIGLLVGVTGWVAAAEGEFVWIDDGSVRPAVRVGRQYAAAEVGVNDYVGVVGIVSLRKVGNSYQLVIRPRQTGDVQVLLKWPGSFPFRN